MQKKQWDEIVKEMRRQIREEMTRQGYGYGSLCTSESDLTVERVEQVLDGDFVNLVDLVAVSSVLGMKIRIDTDIPALVIDRPAPLGKVWDVTLTGQALVRQKRKVAAPDRDTAKERALDTAGDYVWEYRHVIDDTVQCFVNGETT